jgi:hypothetical protein
MAECSVVVMGTAHRIETGIPIPSSAAGRANPGLQANAAGLSAAEKRKIEPGACQAETSVLVYSEPMFRFR